MKSIFNRALQPRHPHWTEKLRFAAGFRFQTSFLLLSLLIASQVFNVFIIFLTRIRHDAIRRFTARERSRNGPRLCEEHWIVVGHRIFEVVIVELLNPLDQMQLTAVFMTGCIEPASLVDSDRVDDQCVTLPVADGMTHEFRVVHNVGWVFLIDVNHSINRLILEQECNHSGSLDHLKRHRRSKCARWTHGQAHTCRVILRVDVFPSFCAVGRVRRLMTESLGKVWCVLVIPKAGEVGRIVRPALRRQRDCKNQCC